MRSHGVKAAVADACDGVVIRRTLAVADGTVGDCVTASSRVDHIYDLIYHVRGAMESCEGAELRDGRLERGGEGYEWLERLRGGPAAGRRVVVTVALAGTNDRLDLVCESPREFELWTAEAPDNPADRRLAVVLLRARGPLAEWTSRISFRPAPR